MSFTQSSLGDELSEVSKRLASQGIYIEDAKLLSIYQRIEITGIPHLFGEDKDSPMVYTSWWELFPDPDPVDVRFPGRIIFNLVIARSDLKDARYPSLEMSRKCGFVPIDPQDMEEVMAINALWNAKILRFRNEPLLKAVS